jgi:hypothetical protein
VVEAPTEKVPATDNVVSQPCWPSLSHMALTLVADIDADRQAIIGKARVPAEMHPLETGALREPNTAATLTQRADDDD